MASSTTCSGEWPLSDGETAPLSSPTLRLTGLFIGVIVIGFVIGWVFKTNEDVSVAQVGSPAPDFTVPLIDGGEFTLSEQLEAERKPVVLNLWASWCGPCRTETPEISAFAEAHPEVKVIGVAVADTEDGAAAFAEEFSPAYELAFGDAAFEEAYPRIGLPVTYFIDADGVVEDLVAGLVDQASLEEFSSG